MVQKSKEDSALKSVFLFDEYRAYIRHRLQVASGQRGHQRLLAGAARCQPSFLSQVLGGSVHLTLDHAAGLAGYWNFTTDEKRYFVYLVQEERAGHPDLRALCRQARDELREKHANLSNRLSYPQLVREADQAIYYSSWLMPALHIAVSVPALRTAQALSDHFAVPVRTVVSALEKLEALHLVKPSRARVGHWELTGQFLHLDRESPFFSTHHINWRFRSAHHLQQMGSKESLHYTSVLSMSAKDRLVVEEEARRFVERVHSIVSRSAEEELVCLTCDVFGI